MPTKYAINKDHYKYYDFLEDLRKSGITNMWGATPYLEEAYDELSEKEAGHILCEWIDNYEELLCIRKWKRPDLKVKDYSTKLSFEMTVDGDIQAINEAHARAKAKEVIDEIFRILEEAGYHSTLNKVVDSQAKEKTK